MAGSNCLPIDKLLIGTDTLTTVNYPHDALGADNEHIDRIQIDARTMEHKYFRYGQKGQYNAEYCSKG